MYRFTWGKLHISFCVHDTTYINRIQYQPACCGISFEFNPHLPSSSINLELRFNAPNRILHQVHINLIIQMYSAFPRKCLGLYSKSKMSAFFYQILVGFACIIIKVRQFDGTHFRSSHECKGMRSKSRNEELNCKTAQEPFFSKMLFLSIHKCFAIASIQYD